MPDPPRPFLDDDTSRATDPLIRALHRYQPLGILDHRDGPLKEMDDAVRNILKVSRLSDNSKFLVRTKVSGTEIGLDKAEDRLLLVLQLLACDSGKLLEAIEYARAQKIDFRALQETKARDYGAYWTAHGWKIFSAGEDMPQRGEIGSCNCSLTEQSVASSMSYNKGLQTYGGSLCCDWR